MSRMKCDVELTKLECLRHHCDRLLVSLWRYRFPFFEFETISRTGFLAEGRRNVYQEGKTLAFDFFVCWC